LLIILLNFKGLGTRDQGEKSIMEEEDFSRKGAKDARLANNQK